MSPGDAGGEYFDRDLWVLTINVAGAPRRIEISAEDLEDLPGSQSIRDRLDQVLAGLAAEVRAGAGPPIKKRGT